jgi:predicted negative regulator of RcsB-dependent stress response
MAAMFDSTMPIVSWFMNNSPEIYRLASTISLIAMFGWNWLLATEVKSLRKIIISYNNDVTQLDQKLINITPAITAVQKPKRKQRRSKGGRYAKSR